MGPEPGRAQGSSTTLTLQVTPSTGWPSTSIGPLTWQVCVATCAKQSLLLGQLPATLSQVPTVWAGKCPIAHTGGFATHLKTQIPYCGDASVPLPMQTEVSAAHG